MTSSAPRTACYDWAKTFSLHPRRGRQHPRLTAEPVVIDYETFSKVHDCHDRQGLTIAQTARALGLDPRTVATWVARSRFEPRRSRPRSRASYGCWTVTRIVLSRSSSVCVRKDIAVA